MGGCSVGRRPTRLHAGVGAAALAGAVTLGGGVAAAAGPLDDDAGRGGLIGHQLNVRDAAFGAARLRERQSGLRWNAAGDGAAEPRFGIGLAYAYTHYAFAGLASRDRDLHELHVPLRWRSPAAGWYVELRPLVATSSNVFQDLPARASGEDLDLYGAVLWQSAPHGTGWTLGAMRDAAFGRPLVYPVLLRTWRTPRLDAEVGIPRARLAWRSGASLAFGATVYPDGAQWHVVSDERGGAEFDFRARTWRAALTADWQPRPWLAVRVQGGTSFARRYDFEDDTGARVRRTADAAPYVRVDLVLRR